MKQDELEKTQILPAVQETKSRSSVREIEPLPELPGDSLSPGSKKGSVSRKKAAILAGLFFAAILAGFIVMGIFSERKMMAENDQVHQQQTIRMQQQALTAEKNKLEKEKADLEQQQKMARERSEGLSGQSEKMLAGIEDAPVLKKVWNKISGKEADVKAAAAQSGAAAQDAGKQADTLASSVQNAQDMIEDVNRKMDDLQAMGEKAGKIKTAAENAYAEHADLIDQAVFYFNLGKNYISSALQK